MQHDLMFWLRETASNIGRNRLMSLLAVTTATIGLFLLGAFFLAFINLQALVKNQTQKLDLVVFLKADISPQRRKQIYDAARVKQVADLQFMSKAQVLREAVRRDPDIPLADFEGKYNPYSDELRINLKEEYLNDIFKLEDYLGGLPGVLKTRSDREPIRKLLAFKSFATIAGVVSLVILGMAILLIIHNAIRLTIFARRREIQIMELVGATNWFIRVPFLLEGVLYGLLGAILASLVLSPLFLALVRMPWPLLHDLLPLAQSNVLWSCVALMLGAGLLFGLLGSWFSLARSIGKTAH